MGMSKQSSFQPYRAINRSDDKIDSPENLKDKGIHPSTMQNRFSIHGKLLNLNNSNETEVPETKYHNGQFNPEKG